MKTVRLQTWILAGLMAAMTTVGTMLIQVPTPFKGYIHIGDSVVYLCGILLGPVMGGLAAGLGSMLADVFSGYAVYAPATLVIKALDAAMVGLLYQTLVGQQAGTVKKALSYGTSVVVGGFIMVAGYFLYECMLYGIGGATPNILANVIQASGGALLAYPMVIALERLHLSGRSAKIGSDGAH